MATREENLKKIHAELEKLTDDELEQVAGGTNAEFEELVELLPKKLKFRRGPGRIRDMKEDEVKIWLKEKLGIIAEIDTGGFFSSGNDNVYTKDGKSISHSQVLADIRNFRNL